MYKKQQGFTLIELMIVVAIIGILAAVAIPSYMDYQNKAKASELLTAMNPAKAAVSEFIVVNETGTVDATQAGIGEVETELVSAVQWNGSAIEAEGRNDLDGLTLVLTPDYNASTGGVSWACTSKGANARLAPGSCR